MFFRVVNDPLNTAKECLLLSGKTLTVMPYITYLVLGTLYYKHILHSLNSIKFIHKRNVFSTTACVDLLLHTYFYKVKNMVWFY